MPYMPLNGDHLLDHALAQMIGTINRKTSVFRGSVQPEPEPDGDQIVVDGEIVTRDRAVDPTQGSGNTAPRITGEDMLLQQLCAITGADNPRRGRF